MTVQERGKYGCSIFIYTTNAVHWTHNVVFWKLWLCGRHHPASSFLRISFESTLHCPTLVILMDHDERLTNWVPEIPSFNSIELSVLLKFIRIYVTDLKANLGDNLRILPIEWPLQEWRKNVPTEVIVVVAFGADAEMQIISFMSRLIYCNFLTRKEWMTIISTTSVCVGISCRNSPSSHLEDNVTRCRSTVTFLFDRH